MGFLETNLAALRTIDQAAAQWIESDPEVDWLELIRSADDQANLIAREGSKKTTVYGMDDVRKLPRDIAHDTERFADGVTFVVGMGLGYVVDELLRHCDDGHKIFVLEAHGHIMRMALDLHDFSKAIQDKALIIAGPNKEAVGHAFFSGVEEYRIGAQLVMNFDPMIRFHSHDYDPLVVFLRKLITHRNSNNKTVTHKGLNMALNEIAAAPYVARHRGVNELEGLFAGKPAIIVSTGPSLGKNIHLIKRAQDKAVIIAVGQALRVLLAYDIKPDFICTIDFGEANMGHYDGLLATKDVPLVALARTYAPLVRDYQGPGFVVGTPNSNQNNYLTKLWNLKGQLLYGGSVAHMCLGLAYRVKADPIIFVGQDLAVTDQSHFEQVDVTAKIASSPSGMIGAVFDDHKSVLNGMAAGYGKSYQVPGYYGGKVTTLPHLLSFLTHLEGLIKSQPQVRHINATEGGARIEGTEPLPLAETLDQYCQEEIDRTRYNELLEPTTAYDDIVRQLALMFHQDMGMIDQLISQTRKGLAVNTGVSNLLDREDIDPDDPTSPLRRLLVINRRFSILSQQSVAQLPSLQFAITGAINRIHNRDMDVEYDLTDREKLKARVKRNRHILKAAFDAAGEMKEKYTESVELLDDFIKYSKLYSESPNRGRTLNYVTVLTKIGAFREAIEICRSATTRNKKDVKLWSTYGRLAVDMELFSEADQAIETLEKLNPTKAEELKDHLDQALETILDGNDIDLEKGKFARPLVNVRRYLKAKPEDQDALAVEQQCLELRRDRIEQAEADGVRTKDDLESDDGKLVRYRDLLEKSREVGRPGKDQDIEKAAELLAQAVELRPDQPTARQGLGTTYHQLGKLKEASAIYAALVDDFPEEPTYRFEWALIRLNLGRIHDGLRLIKQAMEETDKFDFFLPKLGEIYLNMNQPEKAMHCYKKYLKANPADFETWTRQGDCQYKLGRYREAGLSYAKALGIKPDFRPAINGSIRVGRPASLAAAG